MANDDTDFPTMDDLRKDFEGLGKKYGKNVRVTMFPQSGMQPVKDPKEDEQSSFDFSFKHKPKDIKAFLDRFVIKQDEAKKALAIAICDHYNRVMECERNPASLEEEYTKQNIILAGPTGVGKTYLVRTIARLVGVPFVKADATKFSETGYVGGNVEDLVRDLVTQANGDLRAASYGIIYLDEIDKIATASNLSGRDVSGRGVQMGLLKLMEETEVDVRAPNDIQAQFQAFVEAQQSGKAKRKIVSTRHIQFIVSGAFNGLKEITSKRLHKTGVGFGAHIPSRTEDIDNFQHVTSQDFIEFGFEPEFIGRLPVHVACHSLSVDDLTNILEHSEGSILRQYVQDFRAYGIDVIFDGSGIRKIAERSHAERTGARGLMTVCERTLRDFKFELSSSDIRAFVVTADVVDRPKQELEALLKDPTPHRRRFFRHHLETYENQFMAKHGIAMRFDEEAAGALCDRAIEENADPRQLCDELFKSYEHGLALIKKNSGRTEFLVSQKVLADPDSALEEWIRESYSHKSSPTRKG